MTSHKRKFIPLKYVYDGTQTGWSGFNFFLKANLKSNGLLKHIQRSSDELRIEVSLPPEAEPIAPERKTRAASEVVLSDEQKLTLKLDQFEYENGWVVMALLGCLNITTQHTLHQLPILDAYHVYEKLKKEHEGITPISTQFLMSKLLNLSLRKEIQSNHNFQISSLIDMVLLLVSQLSERKETITENMKVWYLLNSLDTPSYAITKDSFNMQSPENQTWPVWSRLSLLAWRC